MKKSKPLGNRVYYFIFLLFFIGTSFLNPASAQTTSRTVEDGGTGPYSALMIAESTLLTHTVFRPKDLSVFGDGKKLPIVVYGNGACSNSPGTHINFLNEISSYGFLVIAIGPMPEEGEEKTSEKSTSSQLTDAIDWAIAQNGNRQSRYYHKIDTTKIAVSGMSCGGLQALEVAPDPRVTTVGVFNSGILPKPISPPGLPPLKKDQLEKIHSPVLYLLGGESDISYENGMDDFNRINHVPVFIANMDIGHNGTYHESHGGEFGRVATAWFQWQLKGDEEAGKMFTGNPGGLSTSPLWTVDKKNIP